MAFELSDFVYRLMTSPNLLDNTQLLIVNFGLLGIFVVSALGSSIIIPMPIDLIVLFAFFVPLNPVLVIFTASMGTVVGNSFDYYIGVKGSNLIVKSRWAQWLKKIKTFKNTHNTIIIFLGAAVPFPTNITAIYAGAIHYDFYDFLKLNLIGRFIRYSIFLIVVKQFHQSLELLLFQKYQVRISIAVFVLFLIAIFVFSKLALKHQLQNKTKKKRKKRQTSAK